MKLFFFVKHNIKKNQYKIELLEKKEKNAIDFYILNRFKCQGFLKSAVDKYQAK